MDFMYSNDSCTFDMTCFGQLIDFLTAMNNQTIASYLFEEHNQTMALIGLSCACKHTVGLVFWVDHMSHSNLHDLNCTPPPWRSRRGAWTVFKSMIEKTMDLWSEPRSSDCYPLVIKFVLLWVTRVFVWLLIKEKMSTKKKVIVTGKWLKCLLFLFPSIHVLLWFVLVRQ